MGCRFLSVRYPQFPISRYRALNLPPIHYRAYSNISPEIFQKNLDKLSENSNLCDESKNLLEVPTDAFHVINNSSIVDTISYATPVSIMENILNVLHYNVGLPWWASIISLGMLTKVACLPCFFQTQKTNSLSQVHKNKLTKWNDNIQSLYNKGQRAAYMSERAKLKTWRTENGFPSTFKSIGSAAIVILVSFSSFLAVQHLCSNVSLPSIASENLGWLILSQPDPTLLLPFLSTAFLAINISFSFAFGANNVFSSLPIGAKASLYAMIFGSIYFTKEMNSGLMLYFTTVNFLNIIQALAFRLPFLRKKVNLIPLGQIQREKTAPLITSKSTFTSVIRQKMNAARIKQVQSQYEKKPAPPKSISDLEKLPIPSIDGYNFK